MIREELVCFALRLRYLKDNIFDFAQVVSILFLICFASIERVLEDSFFANGEVYFLPNIFLPVCQKIDVGFLYSLHIFFFLIYFTDVTKQIN